MVHKEVVFLELRVPGVFTSLALSTFYPACKSEGRRVRSRVVHCM